MRDWKVLHKRIIFDFASYLNSISDKFVLKGGTSLMLCYGLTRFSEDIDLDGVSNRVDFFKCVDRFVETFRNKYPGISYRKAKDTDTCKRAFIHFGQKKPLKVEVSYRDIVNAQDCVRINGIRVYDIDTLMIKKTFAFSHRDKIRDLYDITFIYKHYKSLLCYKTLQMLRDVVSHEGLDKFDFIMKYQRDDLIDNNELTEAFLNMYYALGLR